MTAEELVRQQLSSYRLEATLGSGGMATLSRVRTPQNEMVALKVLFPPSGLSDEINSRFEREALTRTGYIVGTLPDASALSRLLRRRTISRVEIPLVRRWVRERAPA